MASVDISGLDKAAVLAALYNNSRPPQDGLFRFKSEDMTVEEAQSHLEEGDDHQKDFGESMGRNPLYFEYLNGRLLKVNLSGDSFNPSKYDERLGSGLAARVIDNLRTTGSVVRLPPQLVPRI